MEIEKEHKMERLKIKVLILRRFGWMSTISGMRWYAF